VQFMRQVVVLSSISVLAVCLLWISFYGGYSTEASYSLRIVVGTLAWVLLASAVLMAITVFDRQTSNARLRLDWFVPTLRRVKEGQDISQTIVGRWLRQRMPQWMQSNHRTKQRGAARRWLRRLGLSWVASPVRRSVQTLCLLIFCTLFLYVVWPYNAKPAGQVRTSSGWRFLELQQGSGRFILERTDADTEDWVIQAKVHVTVSDNPSESLGEFLVSFHSAQELSLMPVNDVTPRLIDLFLTGSRQYDLHDRSPNAWPSHYADNLARKEWIPAETFLVIDPLVSLSTAIAARSWIWSLSSAAAILIVCVLIPRGFCGYLCPLGTTIDLFDWAIGRRVTWLRVAHDGWWVHTKYYLLAGTLIAAIFGVLLSGFVSAIPVITRGMLFLIDPFQNGFSRGWHLVPGMGLGQWLSIAMFALVLCLGFLQPRFWCKYVCPSGAIFSLGNLLRATERKVESSCINCNKCVEICPFDAIKPDFTTRTTDCTMCQSCGGVCPTHAIKFVERWNVVELKLAGDPPTGETTLGRRGFISLAAGTTAAVVGGATMAGVTKIFGANLDDANAFRPVRPPGSVPEREFLELCIRCGECFKACPNNVLQPEGFQQGLEGLWTPLVNANWAGCESSCNACGQVCPTGAIRALPMEEKRVARMGLAMVNEQSCLPYAGVEACDLCVQECIAAGYDAIEYKQVGTQVDDSGLPIEGSGFLAPVVLSDRCVGCGLCQTRCYAINVKERHLLSASAIIVEAGEGKEDRLMSGSYQQLRVAESKRTTSSQQVDTESFFIPNANTPNRDASGDASTTSSEVNPFGVSASEASPF
jgi:ferredoxin